MGYYVYLKDSTVKIPTENLDAAYNAVCALNADDSIKGGGRYGGTPDPKPADSMSVSDSPDKWFAWMDWNFDETCHDLQEVLEALGFDCEMEGDGLSVRYYDSKTGDEEVFFHALAPFIPAGQYMEWKGEEDELWRWVFDGKDFDDITPTITIDWGY